MTAADEVDVDEIATGSLAVLNEDAGVIHANRRTVYHEGGRDEVVGASDAPDRMLSWKTSWVNVDGRFGVVCAGNSGVMAYRDANAYARCRLEEELIPNYHVGVGHVPKGKVLSTCAVAYLPQVSTAETSGTRLEITTAGDGLVAERLGGKVVAVNFGSASQRDVLFGRQISLEPLETIVDPK